MAHKVMIIHQVIRVIPKVIPMPVASMGIVVRDQVMAVVRAGGLMVVGT